jgi:hypothetical protein
MIIIYSLLRYFLKHYIYIFYKFLKLVPRQHINVIYFCIIIVYTCEVQDTNCAAANISFFGFCSQPDDDYILAETRSLFRMISNQYGKTSEMHFLYAVYYELTAFTCFEHYLLIFRRRSTNNNRYFAYVLCLFAATWIGVEIMKHDNWTVEFGLNIFYVWYNG